MCAVRMVVVDIKTRGILQRIYITWAGTEQMALLGPSRVPNPTWAARLHLQGSMQARRPTAGRAVTRALLRHQGLPRPSAEGQGPVRPGGHRASGLHVAKPSRTCCGWNSVSSLLLMRTLPPAGSSDLPAGLALLAGCALGIFSDSG